MRYLIIGFLFLSLFACKKEESAGGPGTFTVDTVQVNQIIVPNNGKIDNVTLAPIQIRLTFSTPVDTQSLDKSYIYFSGPIGSNYTYQFANDRQSVTLTSTIPAQNYQTYKFYINASVNMGGTLSTTYTCTIGTALDLTPKFPIITTDSLLSLVQSQTLKYFTEHAHPTSMMARERYGSADVVTTGGTGFGLMALVVGMNRGFITHQQGVDQINTIVNFLSNPETDRFHGAFPHWMNGSTGKVIAFSTKDNGADLVETSFLMAGLLTVKEYLKNGSEAEKLICNKIELLWQAVEWDWFRKNDENKLYWHWSPNYGWDMNMPVTGWNEALIVYVLAASSPTHPIPQEVYTQGWARNGEIINNQTYYNITLPLGSEKGGSMFFAHYSFLGLNPNGLSDQYANYLDQNKAHALINRAHCIANPHHYKNYGENCWGLTACDIPNGYSACSPTNDLGVIAPTGALASMPYTPAESIAAMEFFYYTIGDRLWGEYGFKDSFSINSNWFASSYLAIDQGPIVVMIENYRSALIWSLLMGNPDVVNGLNKLGFSFHP